MADKPEPFEGPDWEAAKRSVEELAEPRARDAAPGAATAVALAGEGADVACAAGGASQLAQTATRAHAAGRAAWVGLAGGWVDPAQQVRSAGGQPRRRARQP